MGLKWEAVTLCVLIVTIGVCYVVSSHIEHVEALKAMESGYSQELVGGHKLWVKR